MQLETFPNFKLAANLLIHIYSLTGFGTTWDFSNQKINLLSEAIEPNATVWIGIGSFARDTSCSSIRNDDFIIKC